MMKLTAIRWLMLGMVFWTTQAFAQHEINPVNEQQHDVNSVHSQLNHDPLESYNRSVYAFNQFFDRILFKPLAQGYVKVLPNPVKKSVSNFYYNLENVPVIMNDALQGRFKYFAADTFRFLLNSTVGVVGLFDPASHVGFKRHENDFGLTLARWGYRHSSYFILPFLGPKTIRDVLGLAPDYAVSVYSYVKPDRTKIALLAGRAVSRRAELLDLEGVIDQAALDRYNFERNAYLQRRNYLISQVDQDLS